MAVINADGISGVTTTATSSTTVYGLASISDEEKELFVQANLIRTDPTSFVAILETQMSYFNGLTLEMPMETPVITSEGATAWQEAIDYLNAFTPVAAVEWSDALHLAAKDHCNE